MTIQTKLAKALLGATALTVVSAGTAFAQTAPASQATQNFTQADTTVQNTFTLDYSVGAVPQDRIEPATPTEFKVDRLINVVVTAGGDNTVTPGEDDAALLYNVFNAGNDTQAFELSVGVDTTEFTPENPNTEALIEYFIDADNDGVQGPGEIYTAYTGPVTLDKDQAIVVRVHRDIPAGPDATDAADGEEAELTLTATVRQTDGSALPTGATTNGVTTTENVIVNETGNDGSSYVVLAADVSADKTVSLVNQDGTGCSGFTASQPAAATSEFFTPGACVQYTIAVENAGAADATSVVLRDVLPDEVTFQNAVLTGGLAGTLTSEDSSANVLVADDDCASNECIIEVSSGTIAGTTGAPTTGSLIIWAKVK